MHILKVVSQMVNGKLVLLCEGEVLMEGHKMSTDQLKNCRKIFNDHQFCYSSSNRSPLAKILPTNSSVMSMLTQGLSRLNMDKVNLTIGGVNITKDSQGRVVSIQMADLRLESVYLNRDSTCCTSEVPTHKEECLMM